MFGQTFAWPDLSVVAFLILLEGLLSADNALVLAIMVRHLPGKLQRKALLYGLGGAFVFRLIAILTVTWIINLWWLQAIGAAYLLWLFVRHFWLHSQSHHAKPKTEGRGFWQTVVAVELADIAFAIDSVVAAVALVRGADKVWVIYLGAIFGVVLLRFAATIFINLLARFPVLEHMAYALVGWVAVKLCFMTGHNFVESYNKTNPVDLPFVVHEMDHTVFWTVMAVIIAGFAVAAWLRPAPTPAETKYPDAS
ncbi:MAG: TerC family protein [Fimbriimonadaceae bacterium]|nr:TerC family protein [Fimbriimonadaceae bacterium]QYK58689.1 MAG: TerC family protein [Fimbriimonadaceae bacterium]